MDQCWDSGSEIPSGIYILVLGRVEVVSFSLMWAFLTGFD